MNEHRKLTFLAFNRRIQFTENRLFLDLLGNDRISTNLFSLKQRHKYEDGTRSPPPLLIRIHGGQTKKNIHVIIQINIEQGLKKRGFLNRLVSEQTKLSCGSTSMR
jgi:hypothetical protein